MTKGQDGLATTLQLDAFGELGFLGMSAETGIGHRVSCKMTC